MTLVARGRGARTRSALIALGAAVLAGAFGGPADAYVRSRTSRKAPGVPLAWPTGCVFLTPDTSASPDLPLATVTQVIQRSLDAWTTPGQACAYLKLTLTPAAAAETKLDGKNVIKFRKDRWCHPADGANPEVCYAKEAAAITSVFMTNSGGSDDGIIFDADIEMNNVNFTFAVIEGTRPTPRAGTSLADLENTLTHELGHLVGLSHTCLDAASFPFDVDDSGQRPPACDAIPTSQTTKIVQATMYNIAAPGETKKRTLTDDDTAGFCAAYPIAAASDKACEPVDIRRFVGGGCSFVRADASAPSVGLALGALAALLARTRRRR